MWQTVWRIDIQILGVGRINGNSPQVVPIGDGLTKSRTATFFPMIAASYLKYKKKEKPLITSGLTRLSFHKFSLQK